MTTIGISARAAQAKSGDTRLVGGCRHRGPPWSMSRRPPIATRFEFLPADEISHATVRDILIETAT